MKGTSEQLPGSAFAAAARSRHGAGLRRYVAGLLGGAAARAEAVVEATVAALAAVPVGEVAEPQAAEWLFRHARERSLADLRREGLMARFDENAAATPDDATDDADTGARVRRAIERLTPKQEEVLRLKFVHGFGFASLAEILRLPVSQAGQLLHQAIGRIRREAGLEDEAAGEGAVADARLTAFALGEMNAAEKAAWMAGWSRIPGGKAQSDAWSTLCGQIGRALASDDGAARRKRRAAGAGRRPWRGWFVAAAAMALGAVGWWWAARAEAGAAGPAAGRGMRAGAVKVVVPVKAKPIRPARGGRVGVGLAETTGGADRPAREARPVDGVGSTAATTMPARPGADAAPEAPGGDVSATTLEETDQVANETENPSDAESDPAEVAAPPAERRGRVGRVGREAPAAPSALAAGEVGPETAAELVGDDSAAASPPPAEATEPASPAQAAAARPPPGPRARARTPRATAAQPPAPTEVVAQDPAAAAAEPAEQSPKLKKKNPGQPPPARARRGRSPAPAAEEVADGRAEALTLGVEAAAAPWAPDHRLVRVTARARPAQAPARPAASVVFLLDVSDSMAEPNRLPLVQAAVGGVVDRLRPGDRVSVVTYAGDARVALPPTPTEQPAAIHAALAGLAASGRTNGGAGLAEATVLARARRVPGGVNWVIWCTDGDFNVGASSEEELGAMIDRAAADGVRVAIFGFGRNGAVDPRLEALAARAGGGSGYVNTRREAEHVFASRLPGLFAPAARAVRLAVAFNPTEVTAWRPAGADAWWPGGDPPEPLDEELLLPGQTMTALFEVRGTGGAGEWSAATVRVRASYATAQDDEPVEQRLAASAAGDWEQATDDFKLAAAVEGIARTGREDAATRAEAFAAAEAWGRAALGGEAGGYRREFLALVERWKLARGME